MKMVKQKKMNKINKKSMHMQVQSQVQLFLSFSPGRIQGHTYTSRSRSGSKLRHWAPYHPHGSVVNPPRPCSGLLQATISNKVLLQLPVIRARANHRQRLPHGHLFCLRTWMQPGSSTAGQLQIWAGTHTLSERCCQAKRPLILRHFPGHNVSEYYSNKH